MILYIKIEENGQEWKASLTSPDEAQWQPAERRGGLDGNGCPLPPQDEAALWADPWLPLCQPAGEQARLDAYDGFLRGDPRTGKKDVESLGGYLFALLLGGAWPGVIALGDAKEPIRLQLEFPSSLIWWQLPWELMVDATSSPLAVFRRIVAVSRVVESLHPPGDLSIDIPIRVLCVVGRELDNQLRPGAEYIALLRRLRCTIQAGNEASGVALHARLLLETTTEDLDAAMRDFKPSVVHLISHGQIMNRESVLLFTRYDGTTRRNPKPDPVNAARLAKLLHAGDPDMRPHAVLVNACNTAQIGDVQASFVADLVRSGIPVAVGMAGEVADSASRLFATQFYTALANEQSIDVAAAEGRRAALLHFKNFSQNFDWGRAVFCQAKGVETTFHRLLLQQKLLRAAEQLRPKGRVREVFCGRYRWLSVIHEVCRRRIGNLAIGSDEELSTREDEDKRGQLGKSRLLAEVAFQSVLEGWIPVHIPQRRERYLNLMHWAVNVFELLEKTREIFGLERSHDSEVVRTACARWGAEGFVPGSMPSFTAARDRVITLLQPQQDIRAKIPLDTIVLALREDFESLRKHIATEVGARKGILLIWDQLDDEEALIDDLISLLGAEGLGTAACPVPVIFTYGTRTSGGKRIIRAINDSSYVEPRKLAPFDSVESELAVRQFVAWRNYVPNRSRLEDFDAAMREFEETLEGFPSNLYNFDLGMRVIARTHIIEVFDGPEIIEQLR